VSVTLWFCLQRRYKTFCFACFYQSVLCRQCVLVLFELRVWYKTLKKITALPPNFFSFLLRCYFDPRSQRGASGERALNCPDKIKRKQSGQHHFILNSPDMYLQCDEIDLKFVFLQNLPKLPPRFIFLAPCINSLLPNATHSLHCCLACQDVCFSNTLQLFAA